MRWSQPTVSNRGKGMNTSNIQIKWDRPPSDTGRHPFVSSIVTALLAVAPEAHVQAAPYTIERGIGAIDHMNISKVKATTVVSQREDSASSNLGARLKEIRRRIVASGTPLLSWQEIDEHVARIRGKG